MSINNFARKKRSILILSFILMLVLSVNSISLVSANLEDTKSFKYLSEIDFSAIQEQDYFILEISPSILDTINPNLDDLRIYYKQQELSYAKLPVSSKNSIKIDTTNLSIVNQGTKEDGSYSFVLDMPKINPNHYLIVELNQDLYLVKGYLYGSNNNRDWIKLKPITLYKTGQEINKISLENIDFEYLKFEFQQPLNEILEVKDAKLYFQEIQQNIQLQNAKSYPFELTNNREQKETQILIDLQYNNLAVFGWSIDTNEKGFYRRVIIEGSRNKEIWETIGSTYIYRNIDSVDNQLDYEFKTPHYRYLSLRIENEDNQPLNIQSIMIKTYPTRLLVKLPENIESNHQMIAYWGNEQIRKPGYDLVNFVESIDEANYPVVNLSTFSSNTQYKEQIPSVPLTEKYPFILPVGLIVAIIFIGFILYRNVKQIHEDR